MTKDERLARIRAIVSHQDIETQEDLQMILEQEGINVTQATISRDIKELQLTKVMGSQGRYKYAIPMSPPSYTLDEVHHRLLDIFVSLNRAQNLLVLKVLPGHAHSIAWLLDNVVVEGLVGTIAGDDTVLLILQDEAAAVTMKRILRP